MQKIAVKAKRWGNSLGLLVPSEVAKKEKIKENQRLEVLILPRAKALQKTFGTLKGWKIGTQKALDELDREENG